MAQALDVPVDGTEKKNRNDTPLKTNMCYLPGAMLVSRNVSEGEPGSVGYMNFIVRSVHDSRKVLQPALITLLKTNSLRLKIWAN